MFDQADSVAQEFLAEHMPRYKVIHRTILRLAILDCLFCGVEDDLIAKLVRNSLLKRDTNRVLHIAAPFMIDLAGETYKRARHGTTA